jgi:hypothetical protein
VGEKDGPARSPLGRQPIRKDVYAAYAGKMLDAIVNPFEAGQSMSLEGFRTEIDYGVLKDLVAAAAVDTTDDLRAARAALESANWPADLAREFRRLPDNVDTTQKMADRAKDMKDPVAKEHITKDWQDFFRLKYRTIAKSAASARGA